MTQSSPEIGLSFSGERLSRQEAYAKYREWGGGEKVASRSLVVGSLAVPRALLDKLMLQMSHHAYINIFDPSDIAYWDLVVPIQDALLTFVANYNRQAGLRGMVSITTNAGRFGKHDQQAWHVDYRPDTDMGTQKPELAWSVAFGAGSTRTASGLIDWGVVDEAGDLEDQRQVGKGKALVPDAPHPQGTIVSFLNAGDVHTTCDAVGARLFMRASMLID